jgi:Peptidase M50B-like
MLWLALVLLAATFLAIRNVFGAVAVLVTAAAVFVISYYAPAIVQAAFAYLAVWFLLFGGLRPVLELIRSRSRAASWSQGGWSQGRGRRQYRYRSPTGISDADQLARLTGVPAGAWITLFTLVAVAALLVGASLVAPPGWHL